MNKNIFFRGIKVLAICLLIGCEPADPVQNYSAAFVTKLGDDTLAIEKFNRNEDIFKATVILRVPKTVVKSYTLQLEEGRFKRMEVLNYDPSSLEILEDQKEIMFIEGDSIVREVIEGSESTSSRILGDKSMLPFIDMVHWPFEIALINAVQSDKDSVIQSLFTNRAARPFIIHKAKKGAVTLRHPTRGVMDISVNKSGQLMTLDASNTTRKVMVSRIDNIPLMKIASRYAKNDAEGKSLGSLSGRGNAKLSISGVDIEVDFGTPSKRGRAIFGNIVPWGEVWRTGANRATHLKTSGEIMIGECNVPAGEYTLFTVPEELGGFLIVNQQTNMGGTGYNAENDLCRTAMTLENIDEVKEEFEIKLIEIENEGAAIIISWDQTQFMVPISIGTES